MRRRIKDGRQGLLEFQAPIEIIPPIHREDSLDRRVDAEAAAPGSIAARAPLPVNDSLDYNINRNALASFRSKVTRVGGSYLVSHRDHFELIKSVYDGIYSIESHVYGELTGQYGVPHEILINLTPSEILTMYSSIGKFKKNFKPGIPSEKRYEILVKRKPFKEWASEFVNDNLNHNVINVIRRRERKDTNIDSLYQRLSRISQASIDAFYNALSQMPSPLKPYYKAEPRRGERAEDFYLAGIDIYIGKLDGILHKLYGIKTYRSPAQETNPSKPA